VVKPLEAIARPKRLHESAQETIREYVLRNNLGAGDALPGEMELARQLGISRNSVREAIRALESIGVLEVRRGRGVFVREFSFEPLLEGLAYGLLFQLREVEELVDIRCVLETGMIERAMDAMRPENLEQLRATVERMKGLAAQNTPFEEEDRRFHALIFQGIDNGTFLRLLDVFWLAYRHASSHIGGDRDPVRTWKDHVAILEALEAGDVDRARGALEHHYSGIKDRLEAARHGPATR
jgi:DNA-binding FadR family transcriptional regulator